MFQKTKKMQTGSDEVDMPEPAPGENVYPIYSNGAICGYIYSGGDQKTHKIFLNGENQQSSIEDEKSTKKRKKVVLMKNSFVTKMSPPKGAEIQPTNQKAQKNKDLLTATKTHVHLNGFSIESNVNSKSPVDGMYEGNIPLPVLDAMSSPLATLPANKDVLQIKNPTDVSSGFLRKQTSNLEQPVMTSTSLAPSLSSNVTNLTNKMTVSSKTTPSSKDKVIFSSSLNTNSNQPIVLAPTNNSVLQPTNWMTTPGQPAQWLTTPGQPTKWLTAPGQPTWPPNTVTYLLMSTGQSPVYLANSTNALPQILPIATTVSPTTNTSTMVSPFALPSSATATMPVTVRAAEGTATPNSDCQLFSTKAIMPKSTFVQFPIQFSTLLNQNIQNVSCRKQSFSQSTKPQKTLKQTNLENEKNLSKIPLSMNIGVLGNLSKPDYLKPEADNHLSPFVQSDVNSVSTLEKMSKDSSLSHCETLNNETTTEFPKTDDSNLMAESCQTNKLSTSDNRTLLPTENNVYNASSMLEKIKAALSHATNKSRGRPKRLLVPPKYKSSRHIPILPATENIGIEAASKLSGFNLLPSGNYVICVPNKTNGELNTSGIHSEEQKANVSQSETDKLLTCTEKDNGSKNELMRQLSFEEKEIQNILEEENITIKTEPFDDESEGGNENISDEEKIIKTKPFVDESEGGNEKISNEGKIIIKTEPLDDESEGGNEKISNEEKIIKTKPFVDESEGGNEKISNEEKIIIKTEPLDDESEGGNEKISNEEKIIKTKPFVDESEGGNEKISNEEKIIKTKPCVDESEGGNEKISNEEKIIIKTEPLDDESEGGNEKISDEEKIIKTKPFVDESEGGNEKISNEEKIIIKTEPLDDESEGGNEKISDEEKIIKTKPFVDESEGGNEKISNEEKIIIKTEPLDDESEGGNEKISNEEKIIIKTEPLDDESGGGNHDYNLSDQCTPSVTPFPADIGIHEENNSETESTSTIQEKAEDNELVISSCFSLSIPSESKINLLFDTTNSDLDNLFFRPQKTNSEDSNVICDENSTNVDNKMKRAGSPVVLELLDSSDSLVLSSTEENQIPCSKSAEDNRTFGNSSAKKDKMNDKTLNESTSHAAPIKRPHEASHKSILEPECFKKIKGSDLLVDKTKISVGPFELNQSPLKSKFRCLPSSEGILSMPRINNSLTSNKSILASLLSTDNSLIGNVTKDKEADSFLGGCIAFHEQQLYLLQLQIDQHKTALEKLKKAQSYLQDT